MGTICILLGLIFFCVFMLGGCFAATKIVEMYTSMFYLPNPKMIIGLIVAVFALIGFLICFNMVMHGLTYNKVSEIYRVVKAKKEDDIEEDDIEDDDIMDIDIEDDDIEDI